MTAHTTIDGLGCLDGLDGKMVLRIVCELLPRFSYRFANEAALQDGIAEVLRDAGLRFEREFVGGPLDRFDFLLPPGIVIESKIKGSFPTALRQIDRYCRRDDVSGVVLVSSRLWSGSPAFPPQLHGKPVRSISVKGAAF